MWTRPLRLALLTLLTAGVPLCWLLRGKPGLAFVAAAGLLVALGFPRLLRRAGVELSGAEELGFLLPFASCWGFGEGLRFFERVPRWDDLTHLFGGLAVTVVFAAVASVRWRLPRPAVLALGVVMAVAVGALWEIGEFSSDVLLHTHTQNGLADTMLDLLSDTGGGLVAAALLALRSWAPRRLQLIPARARL